MSARTSALGRLLPVLLPVAIAGCGAATPTTAGSAPAAAAEGSPSDRRSAIDVADALEELVDREAATTDAREAAVAEVQDQVPDTAADMLARAIVLGRLVEDAGLAKAHLVKDVERWAMKSRALDPTFRDEAAARVLGTLWVLAPGALLVEGDSEEGLALLQDLARRRPDVPQNDLRLGEALLALGEDEASVAPLCRAGLGASRLRPSERALLARLLRDARDPACPAAAPPITGDRGAPSSPATAPPGAP